jgi:hypothetical protein
MSGLRLSLIVCPVCGSTGICTSGGQTWICPLCRDESRSQREISVELIG